MSPSLDADDDFLRWFYGGTPPAEDARYIHRVIIMGVHSDATHKALSVEGAASASCGQCTRRLAGPAQSIGLDAGRRAF